MNKSGRHSIRLPEYDYSQPGAYFITICVNHRKCLLGQVLDSEMNLSEEGHIARDAWKWLDSTFTALNVDVFCIMPNHVHAILSISEICRGGLQTAPTKDPRPATIPKTVGRLIGAYKTHATARINALRNTPGMSFWQRNYYERIIRDQHEFERTWNYIVSNPTTWHDDEENLQRMN